MGMKWMSTVKETKMLLFVSLIIYFSSVTCDNGTVVCPTCLKVDGVCHNVSYLFDIKAPFRNAIVIHKLGILHSENQMFFSFEPVIDDKEYYKIGFVNLDNPENFGIMQNPDDITFNFGTFDIDQDNSVIYLGGSNGIYLLDLKKKSLSHYSSRGDTILSVFFKGNIYFLKDGDDDIFQKKGNLFVTALEYETVKNITSTPFPFGKLKNFVINKNYIKIFLSSFGLFAAKNGAAVVHLSMNPFFRGLTVDLEGNVYAWWLDGIYKVVIENNLSDSKVVKIVNLPTIGAMTFDNLNNILFTSDRSLYRLTPTNITSC